MTLSPPTPPVDNGPDDGILSADEMLEAVRQKCVEANPDINLVFLGDERGRPLYASRYPTLADVLLASTKAFGYWDNLGKDLPSLQYDALIGFIIVAVEPDESEYRDVTKVKWNLRRDSLNDQSPETIRFLYTLLCQ